MMVRCTWKALLIGGAMIVSSLKFAHTIIDKSHVHVEGQPESQDDPQFNHTIVEYSAGYGLLADHTTVSYF